MTGFQKLLCLGLDRTPATDLIDGTVLAWSEVMQQGNVWDQQRDTARIRAAFVTLAGTRTTWPAPRDFLAALPASVPQKALPSKPSDPERAKRIIAELAKELRA